MKLRTGLRRDTWIPADHSSVVIQYPEEPSAPLEQIFFRENWIYVFTSGYNVEFFRREEYRKWRLHRFQRSPMTTPRWTTEQFEEMSWHDNHVHAMRILSKEFGAGELRLDIDYIAAGLKEGAAFRFELIPVELRFLDVTHLRISLDYAAPCAAIGPFSIHTIVRRFEQRERYVAQIWTI